MNIFEEINPPVAAPPAAANIFDEINPAPAPNIFDELNPAAPMPEGMPLSDAGPAPAPPAPAMAPPASLEDDALATQLEALHASKQNVLGAIAKYPQLPGSLSGYKERHNRGELSARDYLFRSFQENAPEEVSRAIADRVEQEWKLRRMGADYLKKNKRLPVVSSKNVPDGYDFRDSQFNIPTPEENRATFEQEKVSTAEAAKSAEALRQERIKQLGYEPGFFATAGARVSSGLADLMSNVMESTRNSGLWSDEQLAAVRGNANDAAVISNLGKGAGASAGRGVGNVANLMVGTPQGRLGILYGTLRAAQLTHARVLNETGDPVKAGDAVMESTPWLALYLAGGAAGAKAAGALVPQNASAMLKGAAQWGGAMATNVGVSGFIHALHNEPYGLESFSADALFAAVHFWDAFKDAKFQESEIKDMRRELESRGYTPKQIDEAQKPEEPAPVTRLVLQPPGDDIHTSAPTEGDAFAGVPKKPATVEKVQKVEKDGKTEYAITYSDGSVHYSDEPAWELHQKWDEKSSAPEPVVEPPTASPSPEPVAEPKQAGGEPAPTEKAPDVLQVPPEPAPVLFHGTTAEGPFDVFSTSRNFSTEDGVRTEHTPITFDSPGQIYFTPDKAYATKYGRVLSAHVDIKKPLDLRELGSGAVTNEEFDSALKRNGIEHVSKGVASPRPVFERLQHGQLKKLAIQAGFDGIKLKEAKEQDAEAVIAFDNSQVKIRDDSGPAPVAESVPSASPVAATPEPAELPRPEPPAPKVDPHAEFKADLEIARKEGDGREEAVVRVLAGIGRGDRVGKHRITDNFGNGDFGVQGSKEPVNLREAILGGEKVVKRRQFSSTSSSDDFGSESTPVANHIINEVGGLMSRRVAQEKGGDLWEKNKSQWEGTPALAHPTHNKIYKPSGETPNKAAQSLYEANLISEPTEQAMWDKLAEESKSARTRAVQERELTRQHNELEQKKKDFTKVASTPGAEKDAIPVAEMAEGDKIEIGGEPFTVTAIDPETGDVTMEDGAKYGVQEVRDGAVVYGELVEHGAPRVVDEWSPEFVSPDEAKPPAPPEPAAPPADVPPAPPAEAPPALPPAEPAPGGATSIKNAKVDAERMKRGLPPAVQPLRRTFQEVWDSAMAEIDGDSRLQDTLIAELKKKPRAISDREDALLLHRQVELQNSYDKAVSEVNAAYERGDAEAGALAKVRMETEIQALQELYDVTKRVGTETGRGLAARRMLANQDFSLAKMVAGRRAAKGGEPLTAAEQKEVETQAKKIAENNQKLEERTAELEQEVSGKGVDALIEEAKKDAPLQIEVKTLAERILKKLQAASKEAEKRIEAKLKGRLNVGLDPTLVADMAIFAATKIGEGIVHLGQFTSAAIRRFGYAIEPYINSAWAAAQGKLDDVIQGAPVKDRAAVRARVKKTEDPEQKRARIEAAMKDRAKKGEQAGDMRGHVQALAKQFVASGIETREPLIDAVHGVVENAFPGISRRAVMDLISGYGDYKALSKGKVEETLRAIKGESQQVAKLEDLVSGQPLKKTGVQRRLPQAEERDLIKKVNEAKKKYGVVVTDPAAQLKSAMDAVHTRLRNELEDLVRRLETGQRDTTKTPLEHDEEAVKLRTLIDRVKSNIKSLTETQGKTEEQRIANAERALEDSIADYEQRIGEANFAPPSERTPASAPVLDALRGRRDALKAHLEELRAADATLQQEKAFDAAMKTADELEAKLKAGDIQPGAKKKAGPDLELVSQAKQRLSDVREAMKAAREGSPEGQQAKVDNALKAAQASLARLDARIQAKDFAARKSSSAVTSPELEAVRAERDRFRELFNQLRSATRPKMTKEQVAIKALKARLASRNADMLDRMARADFSRAPSTPVDISADPQAVKLKADNVRIQRDYEQARIKDIYSRQSFAQKALRLGREALNLPRAFLSSWDVSAVLRQGGAIALGNPVRATKAIIQMFHALGSEKAAERYEQQIMNRPMKAIGDRAGLYLAPLDEARLSNQEEAIMSELANKVPGIRASNRAYVTFLNKLRADSFDTMVKALEKQGVPMSQAELEAIANYVNVATGRGNLPGKMQTAATTLATFFFSPRLVASRFQYLLAPFTTGLAKGFKEGSAGSMRVRKAVALEYAKHALALSAFYGLAQLGGGKVEKDPRDSDFGKVQWGHTRVDPLSGLAQVATLVSRLVTGQTSTNGKTKDIRGDKVKFGGRDAALLLWDFSRSKVAPVPGAVVDTLSGTNVLHQKVKPLELNNRFPYVGGTVGNLAIPLSLRDVGDVLHEQGVPRGMVIELLNLLGMGVQNYDERKRR